jgi:hypothetical protein
METLETVLAQTNGLRGSLHKSPAPSPGTRSETTNKKTGASVN